VRRASARAGRAARVELHLAREMVMKAAAVIHTAGRLDGVGHRPIVRCFVCDGADARGWE
jgi:hypothetical protein